MPFSRPFAMKTHFRKSKNVRLATPKKGHSQYETDNYDTKKPEWISSIRVQLREITREICNALRTYDQLCPLVVSVLNLLVYTVQNLLHQES
ncbi:Uncharacterised protein [Yersinia bercovieri]|nr:Uncharacterised protein [Yersinia bercovieri]